MAILTILNGDSKGQTFTLVQPVTRIGRRDGNDWTIPDGSVSGVHCEIEKNEKGFLLRDLGSTNGTKVNSEPVKEKYLSRNDIILLGDLPVEISGDDIHPDVTIQPTSVMRKTMLIQPVETAGKPRMATPEAFSKKSSSNKIWITVIVLLVLVISALLVKLLSNPPAGG
jgi:predicted component of type VI protein secretion system